MHREAQLPELGQTRIMGHGHDDRATFRFLGDDLHDAGHSTRIETRGRLVEQEKLGRVGDRPGDRNALALPSRVEAHRTVSEVAEAEAIDRIAKRSFRIDAVEARGELDVLAPRQIWVGEGVVRDPAERLSYVRSRFSELAIVDDPARRPRQTTQNRQEGGLSRAVRAFDHRDFAGRKRGASGDDRANGTKGLADGLELDLGHVFLCSRASWGWRKLSFGRATLMAMTAAARVMTDELPTLQKLREAVEGALEGKQEAVELALVALLARGHLMIEDVPGVGKTTLARALARAVGGDLRRVQFTSDLLPSDVLGVSVYDQRTSEFVLRHGPVFANVLLADEINRASPRTQSALLEAMNEGQVSLDGQTIPLPDPFFVIATQNPQDFAGTFPLPESQLDRFLVRVRIGYPPPSVETRLLLDGQTDTAKDVPVVLEPAKLVALQREVHRVTLDGALANYLQALIQATRSAPSLSLGASPRGAIALANAARARALLRGRHYCIADDVHDLAVPVLAHRVRLSSHTDGFLPTRDEAETTVREITARVPVPL